MVLSQAEVIRLFDAIRSLKYRAILMTAYAAGLRLSEVTHLQVCGHRLAAHGDPRAPGQGPEGSLRHALAHAARGTATLLARGATQHLALSRPETAGATDQPSA